MKMKLYSIQVLRFISFLGIFMYHSLDLPFGAHSVSIFFVLSGFITYYKNGNRIANLSLKDSAVYAIKKNKKIYPIHVLFSLLSILLILIRNNTTSFKTAISYLLNLVLDLTFTKSLIPDSRIYLSLNGVTWFLSSLFIITIFSSKIVNLVNKCNDVKRCILNMLLICLLQLFVAYVINVVFENNEEIILWSTYVSPFFRIFDFIAGAYLAYYFLNAKHSLNYTFLEIVAIVLSTISIIIYTKIKNPASGWFCNTSLFLPASLLLAFVFTIEKGYITKLLRIKPLIYLGDISGYSYISHQVVIRYFNYFFHVSNQYLSFIICFVLTLLISDIYNKLINDRSLISVFSKR